MPYKILFPALLCIFFSSCHYQRIAPKIQILSVGQNAIRKAPRLDTVKCAILVNGKILEGFAVYHVEYCNYTTEKPILLNLKKDSVKNAVIYSHK